MVEEPSGWLVEAMLTPSPGHCRSTWVTVIAGNTERSIKLADDGHGSSGDLNAAATADCHTVSTELHLTALTYTAF